MKKAMAPLIDQDSRILILGTMPGEQSLLKNQYYGNRGNHFWKLLFNVFNENFSTEYSDRLALLKRHGIALWDVLDTCEREGSLDSRIKCEVPNDFKAFFRGNPKINTVIFASKMAEKYFDRFASRPSNIRFLTLPSPSGANASKSFSQKLDEWIILRSL